MNKYKITTPCTQDWNAMIRVAGGRFCEHCNKTVHDLTENKDFIPPPNTESFCGRIIDETSLIPKKISFRKFVFLKRMLKLSPAFIALLIGKTAFGQTKDSIIYSKDTIDISSHEQEVKGKIVISGRLRDKETKQDIPFGIVIIEAKGNQIGGGTTDIDGN